MSDVSLIIKASLEKVILTSSAVSDAVWNHQLSAGSKFNSQQVLNVRKLLGFSPLGL